MKNFLIGLVAVLVFLVPFSSASAATDISMYDSIKGDYSTYIILDRTVQGEGIVLLGTNVDTSSYVFYGTNGLDWNGTGVFDFYANGVKTNSAYSLSLLGGTILGSSVNIYTDSTGSEVFFTVPSPPLSALAEGIPSEIVRNLVDGGIISTALIVLAIMLGVSLVPRLKGWFFR